MEISEATTANPLPASPARAASMLAFRAKRLVWSEHLLEQILSVSGHISENVESVTAQMNNDGDVCEGNGNQYIRQRTVSLDYLQYVGNANDRDQNRHGYAGYSVCQCGFSHFPLLNALLLWIINDTTIVPDTHKKNKIPDTMIFSRIVPPRFYPIVVSRSHHFRIVLEFYYEKVR